MEAKGYKFEELSQKIQEKVKTRIVKDVYSIEKMSDIVNNAMDSFVKLKLKNIGIDTSVGYIDLTASEIADGLLDENALYLTHRAINLLPLAVKVLLLNDTERVSLYDLERFYISTNCKSISEQEKLPLYFAVNNLSHKIRSGFGDIIDEYNNRLYNHQIVLIEANSYLYNEHGEIISETL